MSYIKTIGAFFFDKHQDLSTLESDVRRGKAEMNITVLMLTNPDVKLHQLYIVEK